MTTIAYDGYILAADTQVTANDNFVFGHTNKIHKLGDGSYLAFAGDVNLLPAMIDFFETGKEVNLNGKNFEMLHISRDGIAYDYYDNLNKGFATIPWVGGSGAQIALTALTCGKNAIEAVEVATRIDIRSGGDVQSVVINERK